MNMRSCFKLKITLLAIFLTFIFAGSGFCQEINLDKMKKVGDVVCYQSLKDPTLWYYLPDQPRLAMKNGKPQFSFMKYSRTSETGKAGINVAEGGGIVHFLVTYGTSKRRVRAAERELQEDYPDARIEGPIAYRKGSFALITSFTEDQETLVKTVAVGKAPLMEGQKAAVSMALSRQGAEVLWESFKTDTPDISLIFDMEFAGVREPYAATIEADWSRVSKHKQLKAGFKYSWFGADVDMLFQELRQNGAIKITTKGENANMDKIIQSANAKLLQVMFDPAPVDELTRAAAEKDSYSNLNQAMKLLKDSQKSSKSSSINMQTPGFKNMIAAIIDYMIPEAHAAPNQTSGQSSSEASVKAEKSGDDLDTKDVMGLTKAERQNLRDIFNRGVELKKSGKYEEALDTFLEVLEQHKLITDKELPSANTHANIAICLDKLHRYYESAGHYRKAASIFGTGTENGRECLKLAEELEKKGEGNAKPSDRADSKNEDTRDDADKVSKDKPQSASEAYNRARRLDETARKSGFSAAESQKAVDAYEAYLKDYPAAGQRKTEIEGRIRSLKRRIAAAGGSKKPSLDLSDSDAKEVDKVLDSGPGTASKKSGKTATGSNTPKASTTPAASSSSSAKSNSSTPTAATPSKGSTTSSAVKKAIDKAPGFSLVASFKMKNIKRSGKMVYKMNHFRTEKQSFAMSENIGNLYSRYKNDSRVFRAVTIDDPVFKQREILVTLDGQDTTTFTKYLNFVTVKMKKQHQSGDITSDEIVITPEAFNTSGNSFSLNYGYKGDTNRSRWLEYQYQVVWSFHGGLEIRSPWTDEDAPMLALNPPYRYRSLTIEGEGEDLKLAKVRHAVVTVSSMINGKPILTHATIRNQGPAPALHLEIPEDIKGDNADVSIKWFLKGGKQLSADARKIEGDIIYWDELPEEGRM